MMKKRSESSRREKRRRANERDTKTHMTTLDPELQALLEMKDEDIDTSDIPEMKDWSKAVVGKLYRPIKEPVTVRLDSDVVAWLKSAGPGYQTRLNALLRRAMVGGRR